jgi:hypothetical protein
LKRASQLPGASPIMGPLATRVMAQAGRFDDARELAQAMADSATDPETKEYFERRVKDIELERVLQQVDAATMAYWRREGSPATTVQVLVDAHDLPGPPVDPLGGKIQLDKFGRARSTSSAFRLEVFDDQSKTFTPGGKGESVLDEIEGAHAP